VGSVVAVELMKVEEAVVVVGRSRIVRINVSTAQIQAFRFFE